MRFPTLLLLGSAVLAFGLASAAPAQAPAIAAAVAAPDRPKADTDRDGARKPAELLAFAGVKPGLDIADIMPGQGYFTRIFSHAVGAKGHVYMLVPAELAQVAPKLADAAKALAADPAYANVTVSITPTASLSAPTPVDIAWTSDNYHDLYGFFGVDAAAQFDKAVYRMLKPGGTFIVVDHVGAPGLDVAEIKHLHRIDPAIVKAQVVAAGFTFVGESAVLHNPADGHDQVVFAPPIRGHTDQFVFKFRKPR